MKVGLTLLTITFFSSATPIKSPKISFFNRNRGDRRTEETTTIRTYQPKYKTLFYFRQLLPNSTFSSNPAEVTDSSSLSPPSKKPLTPSLVEELSTDPASIVPSIVESPVASLSESISTLSQQFPSSPFSGLEESSTSFPPISYSSFDSPSAPSASDLVALSTLSSTTPSSSSSSKPNSSIFNMPNLLRPSNSMTNFFKSFSRHPKASPTPSSTVNPNTLSVMKPPSSVMKPPSPAPPISFSPSISQPLDSFSSFSSSSSVPDSFLSSNFPEESASVISPQVSPSSVNPSLSDSSSSSRFPKDLVSTIFSSSSPDGSISSHGSTIIVAASNPSEDSPPLSRVPKSFSTSVYSSSSDSSINGDYNFSYRVNDTDTKQDFGHSENRVGNHTQGRYDVVLPDGRRQIVDYQVLNTNYFADVSYVGDVTFQHSEPAIPSTASVAPFITNAKIEENMEFPI
uniref:Uncharacterized protein n=1 Tax=Daphnia galeata TaxID=27404 RepID=A0A8J2S585_9CRUS|nr:unnamed protein product [Daphnia galeata]